MAYLQNWVSQLVMIVLFAVILELLLPTKGFHPYVKLVVGLVLIVALMDPVIRLFQLDPGDLIPNVESDAHYGQVQEKTNEQKNEIEKEQKAYIQEQVAVQMKERVKEALYEQYGMQIDDIDLTAEQTDSGALNIQKVAVTVSSGKAAGSEESGKETTAVRPVDEVSVDLNRGDAEQAQDRSDQGKPSEHEDSERIRTFLSEQWAVDRQLIALRLEGGDRQS